MFGNVLHGTPSITAIESTDSVQPYVGTTNSYFASIVAKSGVPGIVPERIASARSRRYFSKPPGALMLRNAPARRCCWRTCARRLEAPGCNFRQTRRSLYRLPSCARFLRERRRCPSCTCARAGVVHSCRRGKSPPTSRRRHQSSPRWPS